VFLRKYHEVKRASESMAVNLPRSTGYRVSHSQKALESPNNTAVRALNSGSHIGMAFIMDSLSTTVVAVGAAVKAPAAIGEGYMIRQGISMFQALVLMITIIVLPFLLVFSQYRLATLMTLSVIYFGLHFISFLWAIAFWMDNNLMALMSQGGRYGAFEPSANPVQSGIILWMGRFMYLIFPMLFLTGLGWAGIRASDLGNHLSSFGSRAAQPGAAGSDMAAKVVVRKA
jgi:uncharacterized membrane protein YqjE